MEWVETKGKDVEQAKELALDQLGVDASEAEFEILEEPRQGLFGRTRGEARVRARIAPKAPRPKQERRRRRGGDKKDETTAAGGGSRDADAERSSSGAKQTSGGSARKSSGGGRNGRRGESGGQQERTAATEAAPKKEREQMDTAEQASTIEEFLAGLGAAFGLDTTVEVSVEDDIVSAHIDGSEVGLLIGPRLGTVDAIQEISRNVLQRQADGREHGKVVVDVSNVREMRKQALAAFVTDAATKVTESGDEVVFEVMSSADRKVVHDTVASLDGVESSSVGEDPRRRVVIRPA